MDLAAIRAGIVDVLSTVEGVRPWAFDPDEALPAQGDVVAVTAADPHVEYLEAFRGGLAKVNYLLKVYVLASDLRSAHARMDDLLSGGVNEYRSLIDALAEDRTLGGVVGNSFILNAGPPQVETSGSARVLTCEIEFYVLVGRQ